MWRNLSVVASFAVAAYLAQVPEVASQDKDKAVTKAYKADFNRVKDGELPDGWELVGREKIAVTKAGGRARLGVVSKVKDDMAYALIEDKIVAAATDFDLIIDLSTPSTFNAKVYGRFELLLLGTEKGKDISLTLSPTVMADGFALELAGATGTTVAFPSTDKQLNAFRLIVQRRGDKLSLSSGAGKKEKFVVADKPTDVIPLPEGFAGFAGIKLGIAPYTGAGNDVSAFQLFGLELKPVAAPKPKK